MRTIALAALMLAGSGVVSLAEAAQCVVFTYYATAKKTDVVGTRSTCTGAKGLQGRRTRYFDRETIDWPDSGGQTGGGRGLPCEFLARGCRPFEQRP